MIYAKTKLGERVASYSAKKGEEYFCPSCGEMVILKKGKVNIDHFAHKSLNDCDIFTSDMSEWHLNWQEKFPAENREVVIKHIFKSSDAFIKNYGLDIEREYIHRADVCINNYVVEFQHSTITKDEFMKRNYFYAQAGYKVIWIFDFIDEYLNNKMECYDEWIKGNDNGGKFKWSNPPRFISSISPQRNKTIKLIFQTAEENPNTGYLEMVTWAIEEGSTSNYKRFFTSYKISNFEELYNALVKKEL